MIRGDVGDTMQKNRGACRWIGTLNKARWLGFTLLWSSLLLCSFLLLTFDATTRPLAAATAETAAEPATIAFNASTYRFNEGDGVGQVVLLVDPASETPVTITVSSANIQAEASQDFEGLRQSLVISPSEAAYTLSVVMLEDLLVEGDEQLRLTLSNYQGVSPGVITETVVTIEDNDRAYLSISDVVVAEDATSVSLVISQSITSTLESVVDVVTVDGSATAPDDYVALFTTAVIPAGSTAATVTIQLNVDEEAEPTESFSVRLEEATNADIADETAIVTILDDDIFPELGLQTAQANEVDGVLPFVVTLSSTSVQTVTVEYTTANGSAIAPDDYLTRTGTLTISPGSVTATVEVVLVGDQIDEPNENLYLVFANPKQAILNSNEAEGIIGDGDGFSELLFLPGVVR